MSDIILVFDKESPGNVNDEINIKAISKEEGNLEYKFFEGTPSERSLSWKQIQDFSSSSQCSWKPNNPGKYMIMVQTVDKSSGSTNSVRMNYKIEDINEKGIINYKNENKNKLIKDVVIDKSNLILGEKFKMNIYYPEEEEILLYRFWIKGKQGWEALKDYSTENTLTYTTTKVGEEEILVECKRPSSSNNVDDFTTVKFKVSEQPLIEIISFDCLSNNLLVGEEIIFKVGLNYEKSRTILYKFLRVDENGRISCIQDYSTKNIVSIFENQKGDYKILCYVRDIFSNRPYDDRAVMNYSVKPYEKVKINSFTTEVNSPQLCGSTINLKSSISGGKEILYRYIIEGPVAEDSGYIRSSDFDWETKLEGQYKITLNVKDISFEGDYEAKKEILFEIDKKSEKPIRIIDIAASKTRGCVKGEVINLKVKAEGGASLKYSFIVYKDGVEKERSNYGFTNWVNFTPEESGEYEVEVRVIDKYSSKEYDANNRIFFKVKDYQEAEIDYLLLDSKEFYLVGDKIELEVITQDTINTLIRYVTKINGYEVEDTGFISSKYIKVKPKYQGKYTFEIYAKNKLCKNEYDVKKEISIYVNEAIQVTNTEIKSDVDEVKVGNEVTFEVTSEGGKDVCYEFYIMQKGNWRLVQPYSKKNYYTFLPFTKGEYRILVLSKSHYKKINYEDYANLEFTVNAQENA